MPKKTIIDEQKEINKNITKISGLLLKVDSETDFCVFFNISGHVSKIEVQVVENKKDYNDIIFKVEMYYDVSNYRSFKEIMKKLDSVIFNLKNIELNRSNLIEDARKKREKEEREQLAELKQKYENE